MRVLYVLALTLTAAACKPPAPPAVNTSESRASATQSPEAEAESVYTGRCVPCHGATGAGDGAAAAALTPRPRNFREAAWQSSITDEAIDRIIREGGAAVGKSPAMPGNPDLAAKPAVIAALRQRIRGFAH